MTSITCFKGEVSFVNVEVDLKPFECLGTGVKTARVGPLPPFVVRGTLSLQPLADNADDPLGLSDIQILSVSAEKRLSAQTRKQVARQKESEERMKQLWERTVPVADADEGKSTAGANTFTIGSAPSDTAIAATLHNFLAQVYSRVQWLRVCLKSCPFPQALSPGIAGADKFWVIVRLTGPVPAPATGTPTLHEVICLITLTGTEFVVPLSDILSVQALGDDAVSATVRPDGLDGLMPEIRPERLSSPCFSVLAEGIGETLLVRYKQKSGATPTRAILSFLARGLGWTPSYLVTMDKRAKELCVQGRACLVCDWGAHVLAGEPPEEGDDDVKLRQLEIDEKQVNVPRVSLVAGNPSVKFARELDPLANGENAACDESSGRGARARSACGGGLFGSAEGGLFGGGGLFGSQANAPQMHQMQMQQPQAHQMRMQQIPQVGDFEAEFAQDLTEEQIKRSTIDDFFYYELEDVPLSRKTPVTLDFIEAFRSKFEDVYEVDSKNVAPGAERVHHRDEAAVLLDVMHKVKFVNKARAPLTTGPVSVMLARDAQGGSQKGLKFMAQDVLKFTPSNSAGWLTITSALNVRAEWKVVPKPAQLEHRPLEPPGDDFTLINFDDCDLARMRETGRSTRQSDDDARWRLERCESNCTLVLASESVDPIRLKFQHTFEGFVCKDDGVVTSSQGSGGFAIGGFEGMETAVGVSGVNPVKTMCLEGTLPGKNSKVSLAFKLVHFQWTKEGSVAVASHR